MRRHLTRWLAILAATLLVVACGDEAHREYIAALEGDEDGSTRAEQLAHVGRAIELAPDRPAYHQLRALYRIDAGDFERARQDLDRAIASGESPYLYFLRGLVLCQDGQYLQSIGDFALAIARQPDNSQFYRGRSLALSAVGQHVRALEDAERLIGLAPLRADSYHARGVALAGLGRHEDAIVDFGEALGRRPELIYPRAARARSYERLGYPDHADLDRLEIARRRRDRPHPIEVDPFRY